MDKQTLEFWIEEYRKAGQDKTRSEPEHYNHKADELQEQLEEYKHGEESN